MASLPSSPSPWPLLAPSWEALFPLRAPRLAMALGLAGPGGSTLDVGCATGSLPLALAAQGRAAHGLDLEPAFLAVARERARAEGLEIPWYEAGMLELAAAVGETRFDLITCLGQTLPHLLEEGQWLDFFTQARGALKPGGRLVIQVVNDGGSLPRSSRKLPDLATPVGLLERTRTMVSADLAEMETVFHPLEGPPVVSRVRHRRMAPGRAADLLRQTGLEPGSPQADEAGRPFEEASAGWLLIARRL
jgi:SAM-dependent methyltransferase